MPIFFLFFHFVYFRFERSINYERRFLNGIFFSSLLSVVIDLSVDDSVDRLFDVLFLAMFHFSGIVFPSFFSASGLFSCRYFILSNFFSINFTTFFFWFLFENLGSVNFDLKLLTAKFLIQVSHLLFSRFRSDDECDIRVFWCLFSS